MQHIPTPTEWTTISLRIPVELIEQIDNYKLDYLGMTRTAFILQAIQEKLRHKDGVA